MPNTERFIDYEPFERVAPATIPFPRPRSQHTSGGKSTPRKRYSVNSFIGQSKEANDVREKLARFSQIPLSNMVIIGETGTGKGLAARILHNAGARADGPLVEVNCAALPRELIESELFGHEAGAFTSAKSHRGLMEQADKGTLFLDEIGELPLDSKLLKAIEDKEIRRVCGERTIPIDIQIIAATNQDLQKLVDTKAATNCRSWNLGNSAIQPMAAPQGAFAYVPRSQVIKAPSAQYLPDLENEGGGTDVSGGAAE